MTPAPHQGTIGVEIARSEVLPQGKLRLTEVTDLHAKGVTKLIRMIRIALLIPCVMAAATAPVVAGEVTLDVAKDYYDVGETVWFTIANETGLEVYFPHMPIYEIRDHTGTEIYPGIHSTVLVGFGPGQSETFSWEQVYSGGGQVPAGMYFVTADWYYAKEPPASKSRIADVFYIVDMSGVEPPAPSSWGRIKGLFR